MFIKSNSAWINIDMACDIFELNRSAYYEWLSNYDKNLQDAQYCNYISQLIINLFYKYKSRYGAERLSNKLNKLGIKYSARKISLVMRENNLIVAGYKKFKVTTTNSNHKYKVFDNLLDRNFIVDKPNQAYVGDITYIRTDEGWLYLATVIDLFSRKLIGYNMGSRMTKDLVIGALQKALLYIVIVIGVVNTHPMNINEF